MRLLGGGRKWLATPTGRGASGWPRQLAAGSPLRKVAAYIDSLYASDEPKVTRENGEEMPKEEVLQMVRHRALTLLAAFLLKVKEYGRDNLHGGRLGLTYLGLLNRKETSRRASATDLVRHYAQGAGTDRAAETARHPTLTSIWEKYKTTIGSVAGGGQTPLFSTGPEASALRDLQTAVLGPLNIFAANSAVEDNIKRVKATVKVSQKVEWHQIEASLRFSMSRTGGLLMPPEAASEAELWRQAVKRAKEWKRYERTTRKRKNEALRHSVQNQPLSEAQMAAYVEGVHHGGLSYATRAQQAQVPASTQPPQPPQPPPSPTVGPTPEATGSQLGPQGELTQPTPPSPVTGAPFRIHLRRQHHHSGRQA